MWVHRIVEQECQKCGPVELKMKGGRLKCSIAITEQRGRKPPKKGGSARKSLLKGKTPEQFYEEHNGRCDICSAPLTVQSMRVDHNHATGQLRGMLCSSCNVGLGMFKDDVKMFWRAIRYLMKTKDPVPPR